MEEGAAFSVRFERYIVFTVIPTTQVKMGCFIYPQRRLPTLDDFIKVACCLDFAFEVLIIYFAGMLFTLAKRETILGPSKKELWERFVQAYLYVALIQT